MNIACTFPGKIGDLLWALPTVRAISRSYDVPVTLYVSQYLAPLVPLLNMQPYIQDAIALSHWEVAFGAPVTPRTPPGFAASEPPYDKTVHLGHEGWPMLALPMETLGIAEKQTPIKSDTWSITEPWITVTGAAPPCELAVGFTDEWFELKVGLVHLLRIDELAGIVLTTQESRWWKERPAGSYPVQIANWVQAAGIIRNSTAFLGCCSSMHVLSAALGIPTIVMEPNPHRHHPIFWPYASTGDRVHPVLGGDGLPTHDARHTRDLVRRFL